MKRLLSLTLCFAILIGAIPMYSAAATEQPSIKDNFIETVDEDTALARNAETLARLKVIDEQIDILSTVNANQERSRGVSVDKENAMKTLRNAGVTIEKITPAIVKPYSFSESEPMQQYTYDVYTTAPYIYYVKEESAVEGIVPFTTSSEIIYQGYRMREVYVTSDDDTSYTASALQGIKEVFPAASGIGYVLDVTFNVAFSSNQYIGTLATLLNVAPSSLINLFEPKDNPYYKYEGFAAYKKKFVQVYDTYNKYSVDWVTKSASNKATLTEYFYLYYYNKLLGRVDDISSKIVRDVNDSWYYSNTLMDKAITGYNNNQPMVISYMPNISYKSSTGKIASIPGQKYDIWDAMLGG